ncbi:MAG: twin-arginine translocase subunit TatC [Gemmatimonadales bacterium]|nr:twin-arginine translocase subunit TatC [Gemmatimonadales bacterium]
MARSSGEMPFLEHLEELRSRLIKAIVGLIAGVAVGIWVVGRFQLVDVLQQPILPLLAGKHLAVQSPTEPVMILLKLGFIVGLILASPVIIWQVWAFLSPALYAREKKAIVPALFAGMILFFTGSTLSFIYLVPQALRVLFSLSAGTFEYVITYKEYFGFVLQVVLAMGLSAELPLLIIMLAVLGVVTPAMLNRFRRYAVVLAFIGGAILSPGTDVFSMMMMTAPLIVLYEVGVLGAIVVHRRRLKRAAAEAAAGVVLVLALLGGAGDLAAQRPTPNRPPAGQQPPRASPQDTTRPAPLDSASARRLGLPTAPKLNFPAADSILLDLLDLEGYEITRYRSDTATVNAGSREVQLDGNAMTERAGSTLEARQIQYREGDCRFEAQGEPHLFQNGTVVVGRSVKFDTCIERGLVHDGRTTFAQQGGNWIISGNIAMDSATSRIYASAHEVTSCDLPESHYHFSARELKWVNKSTMVARPAVLYIRDVPIAWVPFLFQDTKRGRRSGILIPEFGFNDIVRPSRGYNRTVRNIGYYWAPNEYVDVLARFDWFSNRYIEFGVEGQYRFIDKFMRGAISYSKSKEVGGSTGTHLVWNHNQSFSNTTKLNWSIDYSTNSSLIRRNSIDPRLTTQQIRSAVNFNKMFPWGNATIGGVRAQNVSDGSATMTAPSFSLSPKPFDFGPNVTWSPDLNFTNDFALNQPLPSLTIARTPGGELDTLKITGSSRASRFSMNTPLRIGGFQWQNSVTFVDADSSGLREEVVKIANDQTDDPTDSITVRRVRRGGYGSEFDWQTGINLPILLRTSWKVTPSVGITNTTSGPFAVRNQRTDGEFIRQGKRLQFGVSVAPTFYGFFGGIGPLARIRHTVSPSLTYSYSPAAAIPIEFARAIAPTGQPLVLRSIPSQNLNLSLSQNFEGKPRRPKGDTTDTRVPPIRLLSISTSGLSYDFEKAKLPGKRGWGTSSITNTLLSDLVPGLNLSITHDLFAGQFNPATNTVGAFDSVNARFSPFLSGMTASFQVSEKTFRSIGRLLGLGGGDEPEQGPGARPANPAGPPMPGFPGQQFGGMDDLRRGTAFTSNQNFARGQRGFNASVNYTLSRSRPIPTSAGVQTTPNRSNVSLNTSFAPTRFWQVTWNTQYDATEKKFEAQQLNLTRDLHDWRATFSFLRSPNGNFSFSFLITLIDLPDIKFDYRQSTIQDQRR